MADNFTFRVIGLEQFEKAIRRNPVKARSEFQKFFSRAEAGLKSTIRNNPWRVGQSGGGVPVDTGNLRDAGVGAGRSPGRETRIRKKDGKGHVYSRKPEALRIFPTASYAKFVHDGTGRMRPRPWLEYALNKNMTKLKSLQKDLLNEIVKDLAK